MNADVERIAQLLREGQSVLMPRAALEAWLRQSAEDVARNLAETKSPEANPAPSTDDG
jgi:hypothetical protein